MIPANAPDGPPPALSRAALAIALSLTGSSPGAVRRAARHAAADPRLRHDPWARLVARYAQAFTDHRLGHRGRAWNRAHRALGDATAAASEPHGLAALRRLIHDIETTAPARLPLVPARALLGPLPLPCSQANDSLRR
jgi:hypothetical protein